MSASKKVIRARFRNAVFTRDNYTCRKCGYKLKESIDELDAHHITGREVMPNGGYVAENGISLCEECHIKAEAQYKYVQYAIPCEDYQGYLPDELYELIDSSYEMAVKASERLNNA